jgi:hypothetical protein
MNNVKGRLLLPFLALCPFESYADSTTDAIAAVKEDVRQVCTQPATQGDHWQITGDAAAEGGINLRLLKVGSIGGKLHFSKEEWVGVQQVLAADQARDNSDYRKCVVALAPQFLAKVKAVNVTNNCTNSNCAGINAGEQNQYFGGYAPPPARVITPDNFNAAVETLQTAPPGSTVFLNYSAKVGVDEIQDFYDQVTKLFGRADHWTIAGTEKIGPSMIFANGVTLTGEGVGCTTREAESKASEIAKKAMALSGYPCSREAADWGSRNLDAKGNRKEETMDIVISIGTRFIPPS